MSTAPRNTKTTENLGSKGKCHSTASSFLSVGRPDGLVPGASYLCFSPLTQPRDWLSTLPINLEMFSSQSPSSLTGPAGRIPAHSQSSRASKNGNCEFSFLPLQSHNHKKPKGSFPHPYFRVCSESRIFE